MVSSTMTVTGESDKEIKSMAFTPCSFLLLFRKYFFMTTSVNGKLNNEYFSLQSGTAAITPAGTIALYDKASKKVFIAFVIFGSRKADEVIYVVPEKYRPSYNEQGVCILKTSEGVVTMGVCSIKTNGYCVQNVTNADTNCVMCIFNYGI